MVGLKYFKRIPLVALIGLCLVQCQVRKSIVNDTTSDFRSNLDNVMDEFADKISGVLLVKVGGDVYERGYGMADEALGLRNDVNTRFLIASVSKSFVAAAILKLHEANKLKLTDPIAKYFPEYSPENLAQRNKEATVSHLLNHTSGLPDAYRDKGIQNILHGQKIEFSDILNVIKQKALLFSPGEKFEYNNTGYTLLGEIIRRVSKKGYGDFLMTNILKPAELKQTSVGRPEGDDVVVATPYAMVNGVRDSLLRSVKYRHDEDWFTEGNIYSTIGDLNRWVLALATGEVISKESFELMMRPNLNDYGYGWYIDTSAKNGRIFSHTGSWLGYITYLKRFETKDVTIAFMTNQPITLSSERKMLSKIEESIGVAEGTK